MKCLFVKPPFAGYIVDKVKTSEYRTQHTYIRGRIGIIESGTGTVIGDAELAGCYKNLQHDGIWDWVLKNARRYATPVPFKHKKGAMVWINLDIDPAKQAIAPELSVTQLQDEFQVYGKELEKFFAERRKVGKHD
jgi:hypothetical protein